MATDKVYATQKKSYDMLIRQRDAAPNPQLRNLLQTQIDGLIKSVDFLQRQKLGGKTGEVRTVQGWWTPNRYAELAYAGDQTLKSKLAA